MKEDKDVEIQAAKGRPMLHWVGKQAIRKVTAFPAQLVETYRESNDLGWKDWPKDYPQGGLLFHGDNKEVLAHLLANGFRGKVDLIYIDPPFDSGADYIRKVSLRGGGFGRNLDAETYSLGEQIQYTDIWANDNYLQFMYERISLLKELLSKQGSLFLHSGWQKSHHLRCLLDEVFGESNLRDEIIWHYETSSGAPKGTLIKNHGTIFHYSYSDEWIFNPQKEPWPEDTLKKWQTDEEGRIYRVQNKFGKRYYIDPEGKSIDDVWEVTLASRSHERLDFPTQKPEQLIEKIIRMSSNPMSIVLDCFIGSGTTAAVAQKLGRRWIGCDINKGAIQITSKRLTEILESAQDSQHTLIGKDDNPQPPLGFSVYRVNDYDLQIQHNEAIELAAQHIGIQRSKADGFFDGSHGKKLAKIIPLNHPLTLLDLEEIKRELEARPEEDRNITVVCLGKETAVDAWVDHWNKLRQKGDVPNKIDVVELRSDPKYGKFFIHTPAIAKVSITRTGERINVEIKDFISPSIIERLKEQAGLTNPKVDDWRAMVDTVMIDPAYDGNVFSVALADVPEKKDDLVSGSYELDAPKKKSTVAVKITDMLGEEVLVTEEI